MVTFDNLFNSESKARIIKLFIYNSENAVSAKDVALRLNLGPRSVQKPIQELVESGLLRSKTTKGTKLFYVDQRCYFFKDLRTLVLKFAPVSFDKLTEDIKKIGSIKVVILGGVFLNTEKFRVDIFIVADKIKEGLFRKFLDNLEAEVGKEVTYATMSTKEFKYRMDMFDRFVRDILEFPHEKLINKLKIS